MDDFDAYSQLEHTQIDPPGNWDALESSRELLRELLRPDAFSTATSFEIITHMAQEGAGVESVLRDQWCAAFCYAFCTPAGAGLTGWWDLFLAKMME